MISSSSSFSELLLLLLMMMIFLSTTNSILYTQLYTYIFQIWRTKKRCCWVDDV
ncbi:hypothetical protein OAV88_02170 [bacterium]|nr:hypothetical protein [bacterium]